MKKLLFLFLLISSWSSAQNIVFKDSIFKKELISNDKYVKTLDEYSTSIKLDLNNDNEIDTNEAKLLINLEVNDSIITDIDEFHYFKNLKKLTFKNVNLKFVNLSNNYNLKSLNYSCNNINVISDNFIEKLNINGLDIEELDLHSYNFTKFIDISTYSNLVQFYFFTVTSNPNLISQFSNQQFDLTKNSKLQRVILEFFFLDNINYTNQVQFNLQSQIVNLSLSGFDHEKLDFSYLTKLNDLRLYSDKRTSEVDLKLMNINNKLKSLHLESFENLKSNFEIFPDLAFLNLLYIKNIKNFDLSKNTQLSGLYVVGLNVIQIDATNTKVKNITIYNCKSIKSLLLKNGVNTDDITIDSSDSLKFICVDNEEIDKVSQYLKMNNLFGIQINSYCSFTPGGNYHTISGNVKYDENNNGCDSNDVSLPFVNLSLIQNDTINSITNTNLIGNYNLYTFDNKISLSLSLEKDSLFSINPAQVNWFVNQDTTVNFCLTPKNNCKDVEVILVPIGRARPGFDSYYEIIYRNIGNHTVSGNISLTYDDNVMDLVTSTFNSSTSGNIVKMYQDLRPFEFKIDTIVFNVNSPLENPAVNQGDTLKFNVKITPADDCDTTNNNFLFNQIVVNSHDPNQITCLQGNELPSKEIGKTLYYTIEFENTGNYPAENIVVVETIDTTKFDINSLQILNTSHPMELRVEGNKVEYYFQHIELGEHKHGNILLKLRGTPKSKVGDTIKKQANIYFDYNAPVETNHEKTVYKDKLIQNLGVQGIALDESIVAFPNPSNGVFNLKAAAQITNIEVFDLNGRVLQTILVNDFTHKIDLSSQDTGIYLLKVTTSTGANVLEIKKD
jgi:uncharacterized repeat protein (TIGR01451 family)